jgi:hypothetical protein
MEHKLFRVKIATYYFGNRNYDLYVLADNSNEALKYVYANPCFKNDEEAEVTEVIEISPETKGVI